MPVLWNSFAACPNFSVKNFPSLFRAWCRSLGENDETEHKMIKGISQLPCFDNLCGIGECFLWSVLPSRKTAWTSSMLLVTADWVLSWCELEKLRRWGERHWLGNWTQTIAHGDLMCHIRVGTQVDNALKFRQEKMDQQVSGYTGPEMGDRTLKAVLGNLRVCGLGSVFSRLTMPSALAISCCSPC